MSKQSNSIILRCISALFIGLLACNNQKEKIEGKIDEKVIDLSEVFDKQSSLRLSSIASRIDYIQLQTSDSSLIDQIWRPWEAIRYIDNTYFISDNKYIYSFDVNGSLLARYGRAGRGPDEYLELTSFAVSPGNKDVMILCRGCQKVFVYSFDGTFQKKIPIDVLPDGIISFNDMIVLSTIKQSRYQSNNYALTFISKDGDSLKQSIQDDSDEFEGFLLGGDQLYISSNTLQYWDCYYGNLYVISPTLETISKTKFNLTKNQLTPMVKRSENGKEWSEIIAKYVWLEMFFETTGYTFIKVHNQGDPINILYDKFTGQMTNITEEGKSSVDDNRALFNDIDNGPNFWPDGLLNETKVFKLLSGYQLKQLITKEESEKNNANIQYSNSLRKLLENSSINDNPILMVVTLKERD